jgi:hypothetical protein
METGRRRDSDSTATARRQPIKKNRHCLVDGVAVRKPAGDDTGMDTLDRPILFRQKRLKEFRGRGRLYSWLRAHSEKIAAGMESGEYSWAMVCAECSRHGVFGKHGEPPTRKAASKAWQTLCRDLAASGETPRHPQQQRPTPPSRFPKGWTPPIVSSSEIPVPAYLKSAGAEVPPYLRPPTTQPAPIRAQTVEQGVEAAAPMSQAEPGSDEYVRQKIAAIKEQLAGTDWYLNPGVKRRL